MIKKLDLADLPTNKILFFLFNILLALISASYLGLGAWLIDSLEEKPDIVFIDDFYNLMGGLIVSVGAIGVLLCLYGFALSIWRNYYTLFVYCVVIVILTFFGIAVGIVGLAHADLADDRVNESLDVSLFKLKTPGSIILVDHIQNYYNCCGLNNFIDWVTILNQTAAPGSCCAKNTLPCSQAESNSEGCLSAMTRSIRIDMAISGGISLGIALILIIGIVLSANALIEVKDKKNSIPYRITDS